MWADALNIMKKRSGKTIEEVAETSQVPIGTLFKLFSGNTKDPKLSTITSVVHSMGYTLDDIVDLDPDEKENPPKPVETDSGGIEDADRLLLSLRETLVDCGYIKEDEDISPLKSAAIISVIKALFSD